MLLIFSTPVLIRHLWQFKTVVFLHRCLISAVLFKKCALYSIKYDNKHCFHIIPISKLCKMANSYHVSFLHKKSTVINLFYPEQELSPY